MTTIRKYVAARRDVRQARARLIEDAFLRALDTGKAQQVRLPEVDGAFTSYFIPAPPRGKQ